MEIKINDQSEFPDHTPVLVWYPPPGADDHDQRTWAWLPGSILSRCGPDEWHVVIEVPELAEPDPPADARALRNIPACAGPTSNATRELNVVREHPRVRGADTEAVAPTTAHPGPKHPGMVARNPSVHPHRDQQRPARRTQPRDQARSPTSVRLPKPHQPTPAITLRNYQSESEPSHPRLSSKTREGPFMTRPARQDVGVSAKYPLATHSGNNKSLWYSQ
jgi:hypothetical protein